MASILVMNAGSSSLKFQVFGAQGGLLNPHFRGQVDGIGSRPRLRVDQTPSTALIDTVFALDEVRNLPDAIAKVGEWLRAQPGLSLMAIGHRVVHGGPDHAEPVLIDEAVLARLETYQDLAPLHQPNNLAPIRLAVDVDPGVPQVACFDTGFHRGHPVHADCYAIPKSFYDEGVRRYGFHGLSYEYIAERLKDVAPDIADGRVIVAHLGSGASMCALRGGKSIETTMGFTALDGLPMGTRPGQLDPGVVLYLMSQRGMTADEVTDLFYNHSGLKGLSGISNDMRDLLGSDAPEAALAIDHFVYRCALNAGMLAAALGGVDGFVFTAGIGEKSAAVRARIAERLAWLGADLDRSANEVGAEVISTATSRMKLLVIPTDEERMIARHTLALVRASQ